MWLIILAYWAKCLLCVLACGRCGLEDNSMSSSTCIAVSTVAIYIHIWNVLLAVLLQARKTGWLSKRGGRIHTWHRRWFILTGDLLFYYKTPQVVWREPCLCPFVHTVFVCIYSSVGIYSNMQGRSQGEQGGNCPLISKKSKNLKNTFK